MKTMVKITDDSPVGMYPKYKNGDTGFVDGYVVEKNEEAKAVVVMDKDKSLILVPLNELKYIGDEVCVK